jgi:hypothetical protein
MQIFRPSAVRALIVFIPSTIPVIVVVLAVGLFFPVVFVSSPLPSRARVVQPQLSPIEQLVSSGRSDAARERRWRGECLGEGDRVRTTASSRPPEIRGGVGVVGLSVWWIAVKVVAEAVLRTGRIVRRRVIMSLAAMGLGGLEDGSGVRRMRRKMVLMTMARMVVIMSKRRMI